MEIHNYGQQVPSDENQARQELEKKYGKVWSTDEVREEFTVIAFSAPYVVVTRKMDNIKGSLEFTHSPRFYFNFLED
jgi:hypothetical protein